MQYSGRLSLLKVSLYFIGLTLWFSILLAGVLPFLRQWLPVNQSVHWFLIGFLLFIPMVLIAVNRVGNEGANSLNLYSNALHLKPVTKDHWKIAGLVLIACFAFTGVIMGISEIFHHFFGLGVLDPVPWFLEFKPFEGAEKWLLLIWLPMFIFNIFGEELLWRGYLLFRTEGEPTLQWIINTLLWFIFHLPFGLDLAVSALPILILLPWAVRKTGNTWVGIIVHGLYNGPTFILISLGILHF